MSATVRVRRDVWALSAEDTWHPTILAYARAVAAMRLRHRDDPISWAYQGGIHGSVERPPARARWNQCQHGGWYFLPWHRLYLAYFERMVRSVVVEQGGDESWALPYWSIEAPGANALPPAFRAPALPNGDANPLFVAQRRSALNQGARIPVEPLSSAPALRDRFFTPEGGTGFGGGSSGPLHFNDEPGSIERTPHNDLHVVVGGSTGWMGDPDFAALDPIFWLHHANVDRLWAEWLVLGDGRANAIEPAWLRQRFSFVDEQRRRRRPKVADTLSTSKLGYTYDSLPETELPAAMTAPAKRPHRGELVGATDRGFELSAGATEVAVPIDQRAAEAVLGDREAPVSQRVYLAVEGVDAERNPGLVYEVYVVGAGDDPAQQHIGNLSLFGIERQAPSAGASKPPRHVYDITDAVRALRRAGSWDGEQVRLAFRPLELLPPEEGEIEEEDEELPAEATPVRIGRVSVFYA